MPRTSRITLFKWGYEGWGNATKLLVRTIDAVERARGYEPPIFADIRFSRSVRAIGFRDHAFEHQLGHKRYRWMRSLGNASKTTKIRIQCPDAAQQLLDLAIDAAAAGRRVIFFCGCPSPHGDWCHRHVVGNLVRSAARARKVRVSIEEWPGGTPSRTTIRRLRVPQADLRKALNANAFPLGTRRPAAFAGLPWGALIELASPKQRQLIASGPPLLRAGRWTLPVFFEPVVTGVLPRPLLRRARAQRVRLKIEPANS